LHVPVIGAGDEFLLKEKRKLWWQNLTRPEIVEHAKKCDIAFLPLGSVEQHGEHLPTGEDSYHATKIAEMVAENTDVMLLPCPWYGAHPYQHWHYAGTIPLREETFVNLLVDVVRGASNAGYGKFILFNCHGQEWAVASAVQRLAHEGFFVVAPTIWEIGKEEFGRILETPMIHADEAETSLGLYLIPDQVDMAKAHNEPPESLIDRKWLAGPGTLIRSHIRTFYATVSHPEYKHLKHGVVGYPTRATADKGRRMVTFVVKWLTELVEEIKVKYPPGVKPPVK